MIKIIVAILFGLFLLILLGFEWRTIGVERDARQKLFLAGTVPSPLPDGFWAGHVNGYNGSWIGKTFNLAANTGVNNFKDGKQLYPFKYYASVGLRDKSLTTLKIDYNVPQNSWWIRHIVDEVVAVSPNHYLGKIHTKFIGLTFTIGYFTLQK